MIIQHLAWHDGKAKTVCTSCSGEVTSTGLRHPDDCGEMARLVAAAIDAERAKADPGPCRARDHG